MCRGLHLLEDTQIGIPVHVMCLVVRISRSALPYGAGGTTELAVVSRLYADKRRQMLHAHHPDEG